MDGASRLYGVGATSETRAQYHLLRFYDYEAIADYPPLALDELGIAGWLYARATHGRFPDTTAFTVVIKGRARRVRVRTRRALRDRVAADRR